MHLLKMEIWQVCGNFKSCMNVGQRVISYGLWIWGRIQDYRPEASIEFDLVEIVDYNMIYYDEGKIKTHTECHKVS